MNAIVHSSYAQQVWGCGFLKQSGGGGGGALAPVGKHFSWKYPLVAIDWLYSVVIVSKHEYDFFQERAV